MYLAKLNSVWGSSVQTSFSASYNNKGGNDEDTYENFPGFGPSINVHQSISISGGVPTGSGILVTMNNAETLSIAPSIDVDGPRRPHLLQDRLDRIARAEDRHLGGADAVAATCSAVPPTTASTSNACVQIDPNNPAAGTRPFIRRTTTPVEILTTAARDRDIGGLRAGHVETDRTR